MVELSYVNKKGNTVRCIVSTHAFERFKRRLQEVQTKIGSAKSLPEDYQLAFAELFSAAQTVDSVDSKSYKRRMSYRNDDVILRNGLFTFIVNNGVIVTVEISANNFRFLN